MRDCFKDEDMFFGGARYKYCYEKHMKIIIEQNRNKKKLEKYKEYDGLVFDYNLEFQDWMCRIDLPNGDFLRLDRKWCEKITK